MRITYGLYAVFAVLLIWLDREADGIHRLVGFAWIALWIAAIAALIAKMRYGRWIALLPLAIWLGQLLWNLALAAAFIVEHQGLDCATCDGSPMALVLSLGVMTLMLIPGAVLCIWLLRHRPRVTCIGGRDSLRDQGRGD